MGSETARTVRQPVALCLRRKYPARARASVDDAAWHYRRVHQIIRGIAQRLSVLQRRRDRRIGTHQRTGDDIAQALDASRQACCEEVIRAQAGEDLAELGWEDARVRSRQAIAPLADDALDHRCSILVDSHQCVRDCA